MICVLPSSYTGEGGIFGFVKDRKETFEGLKPGEVETVLGKGSCVRDKEAFVW